MNLSLTQSTTCPFSWHNYMKGIVLSLNASQFFICTIACSSGQFQCSDGECVSSSRCTGIWECPDGNDEINCGNVNSICFLKQQRQLANNNTMVLFLQLTAIAQSFSVGIMYVFVPLTAAMGFGNVLMATMRLDVSNMYWKSINSSSISYRDHFQCTDPLQVTTQ